MAIDYSINPYAVGAVLFDQRPNIAFTQQQLARKQAKDDALDNYFRDLNKNVTPAGMRSQDVPRLLEKQNEWQQYYQKNKSAILNPKLDQGKAYGEYMGRYQDQLGHIQESKEALKATDEVGKLRLNRDTSYIFDDPNIINQIGNHDKPIGDPTRQGINLSTLMIPPKPWGVKEKSDFTTYLTKGLALNEVPGNTEYLPGFKTRTPITKQFSDENLRVIGQRAAGAYEVDKSLQHQARRLADDVMNDEVRYDQLNNIYKKLYGKNIESPQEVLAAQSIADENRKAIEYKFGEDEFGRSKAMAAIQHGNAKDLIKYKKSIDPNDTELNNSWVDNYWSKRIDEAKSGKITTFEDPNNPLTIKGAHEIQLDGVVAKALSRNGVEPDKLYVTVDNKIFPVFYKYKDDYDEKTGKKTGTSVATNKSGQPEIDNDLSSPIDIDQAYLALGYKGQSKKQLAQTMGGGKPTKSYSLDGKTYSHKQLNDMGYDDSEINQAIQAGIIK